MTFILSSGQFLVFLIVFVVLATTVIATSISLYFSSKSKRIARAQRETRIYESKNRTERRKDKQLDNDCLHLGRDNYYSLIYHKPTKLYVAGCRVFTRRQAIKHWNNVLNEDSQWRLYRAQLFVSLINNHKVK